MNKHTKTIFAAYSLLDEITPLKYDCGNLCGGLCCENNGKDGETLGMWLLPFEREILEKTQEYTFGTADDNLETVFCNGKCQRSMRPFACRIYPFYANISKKIGERSKISIKIDPRAKLSCPIAMKDSFLRPSIQFMSCAKAAVRTLMMDDAIAKDLTEISDFLSEIEEMQRKFRL